MRSRIWLLWLFAAVPALSCKDLPAPEPFRPYVKVAIMPDAKGRLSSEDNEAGLKGQWYAYTGLDSVIDPSPLKRFALQDGEICAQGRVSAIKEGKYELYFGAGIGFHLCLSGEDDTPPEFPYTLSECPFANESASPLETQIAGVEFDLEMKEADHPDIRVIFREWQREDNPYVTVSEDGTHRALIKEAVIVYDANCQNEPNFYKMSHPSEIQSLLFQVQPIEGKPLDFDFCITNLHLLVNPDKEVDTSPEDELDTWSLDAGDECLPENYLDAGLDWVEVLAEGGETSFKILKTEVTAGQYKRCQDAKCCMDTAQQFARCETEEIKKKEGDWEICSLNNMQGDPRLSEPANCVNWYQARAFCQWAGGRLPRDDEWMRAATGGGNSDDDFPWGNRPLPTCTLAVMDDTTEKCAYDDVDLVKPRNVCTCEANAVEAGDRSGLCDMVGNVWEWLEDWYPASSNVPKETFKMLKGGSFYSKTEPLEIQGASMEHPGFPRDRGKIGFRCVKD